MKMNSNKKKKREKKLRMCEIVSNVDTFEKLFSCSSDEVPDKLMERIKEFKAISHYAMIIHDKDIDEETNEPVNKHVHIVLELKYPYSIKGIASKFYLAPNFVRKISQKKLYGNKMVQDIGGALSYLTHRNASYKHQYSDDKVIASDDWDWKAIRAKSEEYTDKSELGSIIEKIVSGEIKESEITFKIDPNIYVKNKTKIDYAFAYKKINDSLDHSRDMTVIYIHGSSGTGKTTLAKHFFESKAIDYFVAGGSNDPFDGYKAEEGIILDDARPDWFSPSEWLKVLDPYTKSMVRSRYHNKNINAKYMLMTSTIDLFHFFDDYAKEDTTQLYRRIRLLLEVSKEKISFFEYDIDLKKYKKIKEETNRINELYKSSKANEEDNSSLIDSFSIKSRIEKEKEKEMISDDDLPFY